MLNISGFLFDISVLSGHKLRRFLITIDVIGFEINYDNTGVNLSLRHGTVLSYLRLF